MCWDGDGSLLLVMVLTKKKKSTWLLGGNKCLKRKILTWEHILKQLETNLFMHARTNLNLFMHACLLLPETNFTNLFTF